MSATYNWAYKPGVTNRYGFAINASDDDVRPSNACYVALFGNDNTGNGSRQFPYKTLTKGLTTAPTFLIAGSGVYRELATMTGSAVNLVGDGDVKIDISYIGKLFNGFASGSYNINFLGDGVSSIYADGLYGSFSDCLFDGCWVTAFGNRNGGNAFTNCICKNYSGAISITDYDSHSAVNQCTFVNCNAIRLSEVNVATWQNNVFHTCNISVTQYNTLTQFSKLNYSLFFQCNFDFSNGNGGVLYPAVPPGYTYYADIASLKAAFFAAYSIQSFQGCNIADPLFNNIGIGDYSLQFNSSAKNLSYFGTYVGARSIAYAIKASATEANGSFDFSTNQNLNIAEDSITLVDTTQNASIQTTLIVNASGRQLQRIPIYGFNADRNGQYVDSIADLATSVKNAGDTLTVPTPYLVETGAITYNETVYQPGDRLTTLAGEISFTTSVSGTLREILEAPERHTIMARFSDGNGTITAGTALTVNYWYYVQTGSINYNSVVYDAGAGFKAVDSNPFSGSGTVILALSTEAFQHYEPGIQPTSNNAGDSRTGAIIRGNGDPAYVRGGYGVTEFPINAKFIQLYYIINVNNLKP